MQRQVVVSGLGVVSAFGSSTAEFRDALLRGSSGIAAVTAFATDDCHSSLAAPVAGFEAARWIPPMKLRRMDLTGAFAVVVAGEAMRDAGYAHQPEGDDEAGVVFGTCTAGGQATSEYLQALFRGGPVAAPALLFNSTVGNAAASLAGLEFKLRGPNVTISHKEASGLAAIATATDFVRQERAVRLATGGIDAITEPDHKAHDRFRTMVRDRCAAEFSGPFDRGRRGIVMGEGGFGLWIEDGAAARARGARAIGEIIGIGAASAAVSINRWPDRPEPLVRTMRLALDEAALSLPTCTSSMRPRMERRCSTVSRQWPSINSSAPRRLLSPRLRVQSESSAPPERHLRLRRCYAAPSGRCRQSPDWRTLTSAANRCDWQEPPRRRQDLTCS